MCSGCFALRLVPMERHAVSQRCYRKVKAYLCLCHATNKYRGGEREAPRILNLDTRRRLFHAPAPIPLEKL